MDFWMVRIFNWLKGITLLAFAWIGATAMMFGPFFSTPSLEKCKKISGPVEVETGSEVVQGRSVSCHEFHVGGNIRGAKYLPWFPDYNRIITMIQPDQPVTIWTDSDKKGWIWQIEQNGQIIVSHAEIYATCWEIEKKDRYIGGCLMYLMATGTTWFCFKYLFH